MQVLKQDYDYVKKNIKKVDGGIDIAYRFKFADGYELTYHFNPDWATKEFKTRWIKQMISDIFHSEHPIK